MEREETIKQMEHMLHNLNMEGLKLIRKLIGNMDEIEKYNVNTTPERFAEIERLQAEKDAAERIEREKRTKEQHFQYMKEQAKKRRERIAGLTGKEKSFYSKIEKVRDMNISRYTMTYGEVMLLSELHGNSALNASYDTFCYGFYKGMQYLKNQQKNQKRGRVRSNGMRDKGAVFGKECK